MNLVTRCCTFSIKSLCLMVYGDEMLLAYSSFGLTSAQYRVLLVLTFFTSLQIHLIKPRVLFALETMLLMCWDHDKSFDTTTPRSFKFVIAQ